MKIKMYGTRGTVPFFSRERLLYGGNTLCVRVDTLGRTLLLDAGTGLAQYSLDALKESDRGLNCDILLSHLHLDHIIGFTAFPQLFNKNNKIRVFTRSRGDAPLAAQVFGVFSPPYWPIPLDKALTVECVAFADGVPFQPGAGITVTPFTAQHPDNTSVFRIDADKSLVYLSDYEIDENVDCGALVRFCKDADIIIFDSAYLPADYPARRGWGHSTFEMGMALAKGANCGKIIITHLSYEYSDSVMTDLAKTIAAMDGGDKALLSRDGMELEI